MGALERVNLILFDAQFLARDPCEVVGPTTAGRPELVLHERIATNTATRLRLDLNDIKTRTLKCCSQRRDLEAELQSTRHDTGEPTNLECDPPHATAPCVLSHHLDDTLCQRKFVHFQPVVGNCRRRASQQCALFITSPSGLARRAHRCQLLFNLS
jgi:hypothetical protein